MKGYQGKVKGGASQYVKAPYQSGETKQPKVKQGEDLRTGKK